MPPDLFDARGAPQAPLKLRAFVFIALMVLALVAFCAVIVVTTSPVVLLFVALAVLTVLSIVLATRWLDRYVRHAVVRRALVAFIQMPFLAAMRRLHGRHVDGETGLLRQLAGGSLTRGPEAKVIIRA